MKWTLTVASLLACFGLSKALECYACAGPECGDPYIATGAGRTACGFLHDVCFKSVLGETVTRGCASGFTYCLEEEYAGPDGCVENEYVTLCCCNNDLCNAAGTRGINCVALTASMLLAWALAAL